MAATQLFRVGSIVNSRGGILGALKHNKRTLPNEQIHIVAFRTPLNYSLTGEGSAETISRYAKAQMVLAGIDKPRKNGVMAVETIFSLPILWHQKNTESFFADCYEWTKLTFLGELLSFDVHLDESTPHAHAVILPLIDGKMKGDEMKGDRANIQRLQDDFYMSVALHHGLKKISKARLSSDDRQTIERLVLKRLEGDSVMLSSIWPIIRDSIHIDPIPHAQMLGIEIPLAEKKATKSFVDICRSKGRGSFIK